MRCSICGGALAEPKGLRTRFDIGDETGFDDDRDDVHPAGTRNAVHLPQDGHDDFAQDDDLFAPVCGDGTAMN
eukprot:1871684-Lingulodinium_polyedra.AAC.1